jgi:hypothetical protein
MKKNLLIGLVVLALAACKKEQKPAEKLTPNNFRLQNNTTATIDSVYVKMGTSENRYGTIQPAQYSDYKSFAKSAMPLLRISSGGKTTTLQIALTDDNGGGPRNPVNQPLNTTCVIEVYNNNYSIHFLRE